MIKNTNVAIGNETVSEYKIGNTVYKVVTKFNFGSENLKEILSRLIKKEVKKADKFDIIGISADYVKKIK